MAKPALGRGLGALLGGNPIAKPPQSPAPSNTATQQPPPAPEPRTGVQHVPLDRIRSSPFQPRKEFSEEALRELSDSIKEQGIVQPLIVRERAGMLELIAGERRWRASQLAGLKEVPVIVREADDKTVLELALIENLQRENLNAIEEALGYSQLISQFQLTQEEAALKVGKSRAAVANSMRLLKLPSAIQSHIRENRLSAGHAKVILGLVTEKQQLQAAERILKEGLNVRQTEALIASMLAKVNGAVEKPIDKAKPRDTHVSNLEDKLREKLGTKVQLHYSQGKGALHINFFSDAELERILEALGVSPE
jgi:ParB family chromosome partitioning protein